jgi:hypothetical protein
MEIPLVVHGKVQESVIKTKIYSLLSCLATELCSFRITSQGIHRFPPTRRKKELAYWALAFPVNILGPNRRLSSFRLSQLSAWMGQYCQVVMLVTRWVETLPHRWSLFLYCHPHAWILDKAWPQCKIVLWLRSMVENTC